MQSAVSVAESQTLTITFLFNQQDDNLIDVVNSDNFALHCVPCINLFPKRADRIALNTKDVEFHVVPDRARPMDFEIWSVEEIKGIGTNTVSDQVFAPLYGSKSAEDASEAYFVVNRERRRFSAKQRRTGSRTSYMGTECYVSLVDAAEAPYSSELRQLEIRTLCTNRDLPLQMTLGQGATDFDLQSGAPVQSIRCVAGPSRPRSSFAEGDTTWRLINALSLNYLSLAGEGAGGAEAIRDLLRLFVEQADASARHQVESLIGISSTPINARLPTPGPMAFGRGIGIELEMDESGFEGIGVFLMVSVLERFFARYVTVNSFVATTLTTTQRGEVLRWPARAGSRVLL